MIVFIAVILLVTLTDCRQPSAKNDYLLLFKDTVKDEYGYKNKNGDTVIPAGKYPLCFTDTFRSFAIVAKLKSGFVAIDRKENILYQVFPYDNGPDYPSDGLFRVLVNNKIGYADATTGKIVIKPQFGCAFPFDDGIAKVSIDCKTQTDGEHFTWQSNYWFYIDKSGYTVSKPTTEK